MYQKNIIKIYNWIYKNICDKGQNIEGLLLCSAIAPMEINRTIFVLFLFSMDLKLDILRRNKQK